jgi:hypothetical protein
MMLLKNHAQLCFKVISQSSEKKVLCVWRAYAGLGDRTVVPADHNRAGWRRAGLRCRWAGAAVRFRRVAAVR